MAIYSQPGLTISNTPDKYSPVNGYNYWVFTGDFNTASTTADINLSKVFIDLEILNQSYGTPIDGSLKETLGRFKVPARTGSIFLFDPQKLLDTKTTFPYDNPLTTTDGLSTWSGTAGVINESTGFGATSYGYAYPPFVAPDKDSIVRYRLHYGLEWDPNIDFVNIQSATISGITYSQYVITSYTASNPNNFVKVGDIVKIFTTSGLFSYFNGTASVKAFTYSASGTYLTTDQPWATGYGTQSIPGTIDLVQHYYGYSNDRWAYNGVRQYEEKNINFTKLWAFSSIEDYITITNVGGGYVVSDTLQLGSGSLTIQVNTISTGSGLTITPTVLGFGGSIVNYNITTAGTGYHVNDRVSIGSGGAIGRVLAVGGSGNVTSLSLISTGSGYNLITTYSTVALSGGINTYSIYSFSAAGYVVGTNYTTTTLTGLGLYSEFRVIALPVNRFMNDWGKTASQAIPIKAGQGERVRFIKEDQTSHPDLTLYMYDNGALVYSGPIPGFTSTGVQWSPGGGGGFLQKCFTLQVFDQKNTIPIVHNRIYRFSLNDGGFEQSIYYIGDTSCSKYENIRIKFLNRQGTWCYWNFNRDLKHTSNISRVEYKQPLKYDYSLDWTKTGYSLSKQRGSAILSSSINETYTLNSDWITEDAGNYLVQLITSPEVYVFYDSYTQIDGTTLTSVNIPIIITDNSYVFKTVNRDKLFNLTINYKLAYDTQLQNQ